MEAANLLGVGLKDAWLQGITITADQKVDGRASVALSVVNGLTGADVFSAILDARVIGLALIAPAGVDNFVVSVFDDTFSGVLSEDFVSGSNGTDTVTLTDTEAHSIDLATPGNFPAATLVLSSIETLTGNDGTDNLCDNGPGNILLGARESEPLYGHLGMTRGAAARRMTVCAEMPGPTC